MIIFLKNIYLPSNKEILDFSPWWHEFVEPLFVFVGEEEKTRLCLFCVKPSKLPQPARASVKPLVTTEPSVPTARLYGLDSKLYPSDTKRMVNKSFNRVHHNRAWLCWQGTPKTLPNCVGLLTYTARLLPLSQFENPCQAFNLYLSLS